MASCKTWQAVKRGKKERAKENLRLKCLAKNELRFAKMPKLAPPPQADELKQWAFFNAATLRPYKTVAHHDGTKHGRLDNGQWIMDNG